VWRLPEFLFQVLYPISLFILARILFPLQGASQSTDMRMYYLEHYRKFFVMVMILSIVSAVENLYIHGLGIEGWLVNAAVFATLAILVSRPNLPERVHAVLAGLLLLLMIGGIAYNINEWLIAT
jgi:hypothetical protein